MLSESELLLLLDWPGAPILHDVLNDLVSWARRQDAINRPAFWPLVRLLICEVHIHCVHLLTRPFNCTIATGVGRTIKGRGLALGEIDDTKSGINTAECPWQIL